MSRAEGLPRLPFMHRPLAHAFSVTTAANGLFMLFAPSAWYAVVPGVSGTGPFNPHFVRDIGCAFLVVAIGFGWMAWVGERARPAAVAGTAFLGLHAMVHLADLVAGRESLHHVAGDALFLFLPTALAAWVVRPATAATRPAPKPAHARASHPRSIVARLAAWRLAAFEREHGYDTTYLRHVAETSGTAFLRFAAFTLFAEQGEAAPREALFASKLTAVVREDCGPCTQLVARMAERAEMAHDDIRAVLTAEASSMTPSTRLAFVFTNAVLDRDVAVAERLRPEVVARWGERGLVTLAYAIASARVYPTVKYALGYGQACSRVTIAGETVAVAKQAPSGPQLA